MPPCLVPQGKKIGTDSHATEYMLVACYTNMTVIVRTILISTLSSSSLLNNLQPLTLSNALLKSKKKLTNARYIFRAPHNTQV